MNTRRALSVFLFVFIGFVGCTKIVIRKDRAPAEAIPNWVMYGGDAQRTNAYPGSIRLPLELAWQYKASSIADQTILIADSVVYFGTLDGKITAVHIGKGIKLGEKNLDYAATCCYADHHLIIARRYGSKTLFKYNLSNNKFTWRVDAGDIASEPLIHGKSAIVTALYKHIDLYELDAGVKIWSYETKDQIRSSPALAHGKVFFGCDDGYLYALSASTGKLQWQFKTRANVRATPTVDQEGNMVFVGSADKNFYAVRLDSGELIWKYQAGGQILNGAAISSQRIVFGSTDGKIHCLDSRTGERLWEFQAKSVISTNALIAGNLVFWGAMDRFCYAADLKTGEILWSYEAKGRIRSSPAVWGDYLIMAAENEHIYAFKSKHE